MSNILIFVIAVLVIVVAVSQLFANRAVYNEWKKNQGKCPGSTGHES